MRKVEQNKVDTLWKELLVWVFQALGSGQRDKANKHARKLLLRWGCKESTKGTWWKREEVLRHIEKMERTMGPMSVHYKIFVDYIFLNYVRFSKRLGAFLFNGDKKSWTKEEFFQFWTTADLPNCAKQPTYFIQRYKDIADQPLDQDTLILDVILALSFGQAPFMGACLLTQIQALEEHGPHALIWDPKWLDIANEYEQKLKEATQNDDDDVEEGEVNIADDELPLTEAPETAVEPEVEEGTRVDDQVATVEVETQVQEASQAETQTLATEPIAVVDGMPIYEGDLEPTVPVQSSVTPSSDVVSPDVMVSPFKSEDRRQVPVRNYFESQRKVTLPALKPGLGRYLGYVRKNSGNFQNFYFIADWAQDRFGEIEASLAKQRFPKWGAVNLAIEQRKGPKEGGFFVMDVDEAEWELNRDENHEPRQDYVYRVNYNRLLSERRFLPASAFGIYPVVRPAPTMSQPLDLTRAVEVMFTDRAADEAHVELSNEWVMLEANGLLYGPVRVRESAKKQPYVQLVDRMGVVEGFKIERRYYHSVAQFVRGTESTGHTYVSMLCVDTQFMTPIDIDIWSDAELVKHLTSSKSFKDVGALAEMIERGDVFFSSNPDISLARQQRLKNMILRVNQRADTREAFADFLAREVLQRKDKILTAVVRCIANDNELLKVLTQNATIGKEMDGLKALHKSLNEQVAARRQEVKKALNEVQHHERQVAELQKSINAKTKALGLFDENTDIIDAFKSMDARIDEARQELNRLKGLQDQILEDIKAEMTKASSKVGDALPLDVTQAVQCWDEAQEARRVTDVAEAVNEVSYQGPTGQSLANALVRYVQSQRAYDDNTVLNLYLSMVQNFLTVLSGAPGVGKTSICGILAESLGMNTFNEVLDESLRARISANRFLCVPVEYGWTTKRDFIGYWNPLTSRFESPDPDRWQLIRRLDAEARSEKGSVYPAMMLLDEANLSPMEYYWSDWMRLCDEEAFPGDVRLWDKAITKVPETLRFMATINNDNTTEGLSPRLIDRAGIITLPDTEDTVPTVPADRVTVVRAPWEQLKSVFGAREITDHAQQTHQVLDEVYRAFSAVGIRFSPRARHQITGYVGAATSVFKAKHAKPAYLEAIDFAVMQKGLPRVSGTGSNYCERLEGLRQVLDRLSLDRSVALLDQIIQEGKDALDCYRFF